MSPFDKMPNVSFRFSKADNSQAYTLFTLFPSSSSSNSTPHSSKPPSQPQLSKTPLPSMLSIPPGSDEGEPMSLSDFPAPNDVSEVQDLEQDLNRQSIAVIISL